MSNRTQVGGIVYPAVVGGVIKNRPPTRGEAAGPVVLPGLHDTDAIRAQREALRQEEAARAQKST